MLESLIANERFAYVNCYDNFAKSIITDQHPKLTTLN